MYFVVLASFFVLFDARKLFTGISAPNGGEFSNGCEENQTKLKLTRQSTTEQTRLDGTAQM